jgi:hypothetical protein
VIDNGRINWKGWQSERNPTTLYGPTKSIVANVLICSETAWQSFQVLPHALEPDGLFCGWSTSATFSAREASSLVNFHLIFSHISRGRIRIGVHDTKYTIGRANITTAAFGHLFWGFMWLRSSPRIFRISRDENSQSAAEASINAKLPVLVPPAFDLAGARYASRLF